LPSGSYRAVVCSGTDPLTRKPRYLRETVKTHRDAEVAMTRLLRQLCGGRRRAGHTCRPLSGSTVRKIHFILSGALELAVRWRHVGVNRAAMARAPSPSRPEPDPPNAAEAAALLNAAWADPDWGLLLWLTMVTGLRRGEVSALRWSHVDVDRGGLLVRRANAQPKAGVLESDEDRISAPRASQRE
jgi:integrase